MFDRSMYIMQQACSQYAVGMIANSNLPSQAPMCYSLCQANHLVSDVFHSHHDNQLSDMTSLLTFRFFLGAHSVMSHLQPGRRHVTLLAITNSNTATTELIEQVGNKSIKLDEATCH